MLKSIRDGSIESEKEAQILRRDLSKWEDYLLNSLQFGSSFIFFSLEKSIEIGRKLRLHLPKVNSKLIFSQLINMQTPRALFLVSLPPGNHQCHFHESLLLC